jgi:molybdopterin synthase catalytic subunit
MSGKETERPARIDTGVVAGPVELTPWDWSALTDCGAEAAFIGRTREETHVQFGRLLRLEYQVYAPMAQKLLRQMTEEAARRWGCRAVRVVHACGLIGVGQASIVIQTAAPHRGAALAACAGLIERVKHELPVWKREVWERGQTFVAGCQAVSESAPVAVGANQLPDST